MKKLLGIGLVLALFAPLDARADWCYSYDTSPTYNGSGERVPQNCGLYGQTKVMIVDSSGAVASIGGGTQYTEGDTDATITGNAILWEDAANTLRVPSSTYPLPVNIISGAGSGGTAMTDDAAFTPATTSVTPIGGVFDDTTPDSVDEGDGGAVRMSANRNLYTTLRDAAGNERGANVNASNELLTNANTELPAAAALADNTANPTVPGVAAFLMCYDGSTWDRCQGGLTDTDDGTIAGAQVPGLMIPLNYVHDGTNWVRQRKVFYAEDAAHTDGDQGVAVLGRRIDTLAASSGTSGDYETVNLNGSGAVWTSPSASTNGGCTPTSLLSAATVNETEVKATAGQVYWVQATNVNASPAYLKFYNDTAANTDETDTPVLRLAIPGSTTAGGFTTSVPVGMAFSTAITYRITTAVADNSTAAVAANEVLVNVCYK